MNTTVKKVENILLMLLEDSKCNPLTFNEKVSSFLSKESLTVQDIKLFLNENNDIEKWEKTVCGIFLQVIEKMQDVPKILHEMRYVANNIVEKLSAHYRVEDVIKDTARENNFSIVQVRDHVEQELRSSNSQLRRVLISGIREGYNNIVASGAFVPSGNVERGVFEKVQEGDFDYLLASSGGVLPLTLDEWNCPCSEELDHFMELLAVLFANLYISIETVLLLHSSPAALQCVYDAAKDKRPFVPGYHLTLDVLPGYFDYDPIYLKRLSPKQREIYLEYKKAEKAIKKEGQKERRSESQVQEFKTNKRTKRNGIIGALIALVIVVLLFIYSNKVLVPSFQYDEAIDLMNDGSYAQAFNIFSELEGYKDSAERAREIKMIMLKNCKVGDYINFGNYEQDNKKSNGKEDIEWLVLDVKDGRVLVVSKYVLDYRPYSDYDGGVYWESCALRSWLNKDFVDIAFSEEEELMIPTLLNPIDQNPEYTTYIYGNIQTGPDSEDKVFLLSVTEVNTYLSSENKRVCEDSRYAQEFCQDSNASYWLRTHGEGQRYATTINSQSGKMSYSGKYVTQLHGIRPAMWIDISSIS